MWKGNTLHFPQIISSDSRDGCVKLSRTETSCEEDAVDIDIIAAHITDDVDPLRVDAIFGDTAGTYNEQKF